MMREQKIEFSFSSALSGVDPDTGTWQKDLQEAMAKKIRGRIMAQSTGDGICGMNIARYGMYVEYFSEIISFNEVVVVVREAIEWATHNVEGAFPIREGKTVDVTVDTKLPTPRTPSGKMEITANLLTNLFAYPTTEDESKRLKALFATELLQLDGVVGYGVFIDGIRLTIKTAITSVDAAKAHMQQLLEKHAENKESEFLPFLHDDLFIDWSVREPLV